MKSFLKKAYPESIFKIFIVLLVVLLGIKVFYLSQYSNGLFSKSLRNSEWMTVNGGMGYADNGFFSNGGLPNIKYDPSSPNSKDKFFIKLTYPPAPHWLAGLYIKICGADNGACYRIFPAIFGILALVFVARTLMSVLEPVKSALMMLALALVPATIIMMHGLTYLTYSSTLFLAYLALLLKVVKDSSGDNKSHYIVLYIAGFIQGWFSWDYLFLICFSAVPFALLYYQDTKKYRRHILLIIIVCAGGFLFAHLLHTIQVIIYKGGVLAAFEPLYKKTMNRFDGSFTSEVFHFEEGRLRILLTYLNVYASNGFFYKINFLGFIIFSFILMLIREANVIFQRPVQLQLSWKSSPRNFFVILSAFIISTLWIFIMKQHAYFHPDFHPMHLYLLYFVCVLSILECVSFHKYNVGQ